MRVPRRVPVAGPHVDGLRSIRSGHEESRSEDRLRQGGKHGRTDVPWHGLYRFPYIEYAVKHVADFDAPLLRWVLQPEIPGRGSVRCEDIRVHRADRRLKREHICHAIAGDEE